MTHPIEERWPTMSLWQRIKWQFAYAMRDPYDIFDENWCKRMGISRK